MYINPHATPNFHLKLECLNSKFKLCAYLNWWLSLEKSQELQSAALTKIVVIYHNSPKLSIFLIDNVCILIHMKHQSFHFKLEFLNSNFVHI